MKFTKFRFYFTFQIRKFSDIEDFIAYFASSVGQSINYNS